MIINDFQAMKDVLLRDVVSISTCWSQFIWGTISRMIPDSIEDELSQKCMEQLRNYYSDNRQEVFYTWNMPEIEPHIVVHCRDLSSFTECKLSIEPEKMQKCGLAWILLMGTAEQYEIENAYYALRYFKDAFLRECEDKICSYLAERNIIVDVEERRKLLDKEIDVLLERVERTLQNIEDAEVYKGIFWFSDISSKAMICAKIPCYADGKIIKHNNMPLNSKRGDNYNHEKTWNSFPGNITKGKMYNFYPRGRVEISKGKAKIFLNSNLVDEAIIDFIKEEFCLCEEKGIMSIKVIPDYSEHYRCYLDD